MKTNTLKTFKHNGYTHTGTTMMELNGFAIVEVGGGNLKSGLEFKDLVIVKDGLVVDDDVLFEAIWAANRATTRFLQTGAA